MKPGTSFDTNASLALLLLGESGSGKSSIAIRFPSPGFILGDKNIKYAATWATEHNHSWHYDDPEVDATGKPLDWPERWKRSWDILIEMGRSPDVKTIVDDGLTHLSSYLQARLIKEGSKAESPLVIGGESQMTRSLWGPFASNLKRRIVTARSFNKPYIMIAHVQTGENEMSGAKEQQVNLQGALRNEIGGWFSDVYQTLAIPSTDAKYKDVGGIRRYVRTEPTHRCGILKNSFRLPPELDVEDLVKRICPAT